MNIDDDYPEGSFGYEMARLRRKIDELGDKRLEEQIDALEDRVAQRRLDGIRRFFRS